MNAEIEKIPNFDIAVRAESLEDDLFAVYSRLFPGTARSDLIFTELQGGFVNSIIRVTPKKGAKGTNDKSLVFRTFGLNFDEEEFNKAFTLELPNGENKENAGQENGQKLTNGNSEKEKSDVPTESDFSKMLFNRFAEYKVMHVVSKFGLCQPVYGTYENGIVYGFTEGTTLNGPLMLTNDFLNESSRKLGLFHSIDYEVPDAKFPDHYDRMENGMRKAFQGNFEEMDKQIQAINEGPYKEVPRVQVLFDCEKRLLDTIIELGLGELVLCHNDANQKNIIWNAQTRTLGFIDFEMTLKNYPAFELGYLIGCCTGHFLCDFDGSLYPNEAYRREFCRKYLTTFYEHKAGKKMPAKEQFEQEVEELYHKVSLASLLNMLRWALYSSFFDLHPEMLKNKDLQESREKDKYYNVKYALKIYRFVLSTSEKFLEEAENYLKRRKQTKV